MSAHEREAVSVQARDGRALEVVLAGPPEGIPLFSHHGTPGAAGVFDRLVAVGAQRGVRHITYSRPGYGGSDRHPGRTVADCAADVVAIADALGYRSFLCVGGSGGGPHSIACAALLGDRVRAAAAIASPAPVGAEGLDWQAGMGQENIEEFAAARAGDEALERFLEGAAQELAGASPEQMVSALGDLVSEVDRRALSGELGAHMLRQLAAALAPGVWGWFDDDRALLEDWGFALSSVRAPLSLWHGAQDRFVPIAHGQWLAAHLTADSHLLDDHGHLSLAVSSYGEILDSLLAH